MMFFVFIVTLLLRYASYLF